MTSEASQAGQAQHMGQSAQLVPTTGSNQMQEQRQFLTAMVEEMRVLLEQRGQRGMAGTGASSGATPAAQRGIRNDSTQLVGMMVPTTVPSTYPSVKYPKESPPLFRGTVD